MRLYKRGRTWWCSVYVDGKRVRVSTRCHDRAAAESAARQLERDAADPAGAAAKAATLGDALKALVDERTEAAKAGRKAEATVEFYKKKAAVLTRLFEGDEDYVPFPLSRLHSADVDDYITRRRGEGVSESTISKELVTLRAALKIAVRRRLWSGDPAAVCPIAFAPEYKPRQRWLNFAELDELLAQLSEDRAARVALMVATSAEWGATERAERADIQDDQVLVRGTKRKTRWRAVPLVLPWQKILARFAKRHGGGAGERLFAPWPNVRRDLHAACERAQEVFRETQRLAGLPENATFAPASPNDIRRTFAHWGAASGLPFEVLAPLMGHADTRMVARVYAKRTPAELAEVMRRAAGIAGGGCDTGVPDKMEMAGLVGVPPSPKPAKSVPRDGIEPSTRGFSVPPHWQPRYRKEGHYDAYKRRAVTRACQRDQGVA